MKDVTIHMTATEPNVDGEWMWYCRCEAYLTGFETRSAARKSADEHLDQTNGAT